MIRLIVFSYVVSFVCSAQANVLSNQDAERFIRHLAANSDSLKADADPAEYRLSGRLGIKYIGVKNKFLISYELRSDIIQDIESGNYKYRIDSLDTQFSRLSIIIPGKNIQQDYCFRNGKLVSPLAYYSRNWKRIDSRYFVFIVDDTNACNSYSIAVLDAFVKRIANKLRFGSDAFERLRREKIYYYICKDQDEIEKLTGFKTRGIYNLAYDCIISTYTCHYHELLHLLMNYRLGVLPLYTSPFLQEGFAVAFGGRGGLDPDVVLEAGLYLEQSGMMDFSQLLTRREFMENDASLTYPVSGLYSKFLFEKLGATGYINLYRKCSGAELQVDTMRIDTSDLPSSREYADFMRKEISRNIIEVKLPANFELTQGSDIAEDSSRFYFRVRDTLLIAVNGQPAIFYSKKFAELFPSRKYRGEKYAIIVNPSEVLVYNLFTGNLIASYVESFALPPLVVPNRDGYFYFSIFKRVFDEGMTEWRSHS
ncbi:MAG TPA: hypothetical protein VLX91_06370 [Candidatus Acidoferrales bacterium]|nr:hypothetical protein [Candidatus Acidoferrales bacterium]